MPIIFDEKQNAFYLNTPSTTYIAALSNNGNILRHIYWGKTVERLDNIEDYFVAANFTRLPYDGEYNKELVSGAILKEFAEKGGPDYRFSAYSAIKDNYPMLVSPKVKSWKIVAGKPDLEGLPHTYTESDGEAETLEITIEEQSGIRVTLSYTVYRDFDAIARHAVIENISDTEITLEKALSASVDFEDTGFEMVHLYGSWARERHIERTPVANGITSIGSSRGTSSYAHNPFFALVRPDTTEQSGECYGFNLVYSGNFIAGTEKTNDGVLRAFIGLNPENFSWVLAPGESFTTPEAVMVYSADGLSDMSQTFHSLYRSRLCRGKWRDSVRPILINNWEGTYFDFNEEKILNIAKQGKELGIELMVLDDGWFGKRDDDTTSLGDWFVDKRKLPNGIGGLAKKVTDLGMKFGLWFEPEMISPESELHRAHPDWHIHIPGRQACEGRNQWVLDLSNPKVQDYIIEVVGSILRSADISYVKWDMNRDLADLGSAYLSNAHIGELTHRYYLGLYRVMEALVTEFPDVLFEGCAGGGSRFDAGILYYMPQIWTSDCSDAIERLKIQYGTSMVYPTSAMGAHVSAVPNHQVGRSASLKTRGDVAMLGQFGYELDADALTDEEKEEIKQQIAFYKRIRETVQFGDQYRLRSPFEGNTLAWNFVSRDGGTVIFAFCGILAQVRPPYEWIKLCGLDAGAKYRDEETGKVYGGDELMNIGLRRCVEKDFCSEIRVFKRI